MCYYCDDKSFVRLLHDRQGGAGVGWSGIEGARWVFGCLVVRNILVMLLKICSWLASKLLWSWKEKNITLIVKLFIIIFDKYRYSLKWSLLIILISQLISSSKLTGTLQVHSLMRYW